MKKKGIVIAFITLTITYVLAILLIVLPKKEYSENENRYLATFPQFTLKSVTSGEFMSGVEDYVTDHFPFRDFWISLKSETAIALGQREINGIYVCEDDYLIQKYNPLANKKRIKDTFSNFAAKLKEETGNDAVFMLVPTAVTICDDKLPKMAESSMTASQLEDIKELCEDLNCIDCAEELENAWEEAAAGENQIYYRTDHHWTTYGAYVGYCEYCRSMGLECVDIDDLSMETVADDFYGTVSSKLNRFNEKADCITVYSNPSDELAVKYYTQYVDDENSKFTESDSLYNFDYLGKKDKYSMFLDGVHPLVEITNENAQTDRVLMLVKDSYANSMVPYLASNYAKIYVLDTRYYKNGAVAFAGSHTDITDVCVLYNMITIDSDNGIRGIF